MSRKLLFLLCTQLLVQSISSQCIGAIDAPWAATPINAAPCTGAWGEPFAAEWACSPVAILAASNGPGLVVSTASPVVPAGVSIISNNAYEGALAVGGALPFLGTVAIEGALPTAGAGAIAYGCGNGAVGITAENFGAVGFVTNGASLIAAPLTMGPLATAPLTVGPKAAGPCIESWNAADLAASNGPGVAVSTVSPLIPTGVSVLSANAYEGVLAAGGALPFLGTVALEGALPTAGAGAVAYGCGNGAVGITTEDMGAIGFTGIAGPLGYGSGLAGPLGYGAARAGSFGIAGPGCGCGYGAIY